MNFAKPMKNFIVFAVLIASFSSFSQKKIEKESDIKVVYEFNYKKFVESDNVRTANTILINKKEEALFTFDKMIRLDSLQQFRPLESSEVMLYRSPYFFLIKRKNKEVSHYETIGNDLLKFNDTVSLNWNLVNEEKLISTYNCKKATLNFLGRDWVAWYTTEIPVNTGPYKFFGLPGLIINIQDTESVFEFTAVEIERGDYSIDSNIKNYFVSEDGEKFHDIEKEEFYEIKTKYYEMSLNERLKYMNREKEEDIYYFDIKSTTGEKVRTNRKSKARNFIERNKEEK